MIENHIDVKKIRHQLPHGAMVEIAKNANVSRNTVSLVLKGDSQNQSVLDAIADYLVAFSQRKNLTNEKLLSLIN